MFWKNVNSIWKAVKIVIFEGRNKMTDRKQRDIMSAKDPESCLQIHGERRMLITMPADCNIMNSKEKLGTPKF